MTNEEKQILLIDLCARSPYGVRIAKGNLIYPVTGVNIALGYVELAVFERISIEEVKPYLRPMSSMTEEEREELIGEFGADIRDEDNGRHTEKYGYVMVYHNFKEESWFIPFEATDFLNAHHFDYRGLIGKGLALEAPEGMY